MFPGKFKIKIVRIAVVAICASKYSFHIMELANGQESQCDNKLPLIDS